MWLPRGCINSKHCLPLCASGLGSGGTIAWKNVIFKNNPFPLNNAISKPFPVYSALWDFRCESICHGFHRCIKQERQTSSENKCQFSKFCHSPLPPPFKKNYWVWLCVVNTVAVFLSWQVKYNRVNQSLLKGYHQTASLVNMHWWWSSRKKPLKKGGKKPLKIGFQNLKYLNYHNTHPALPLFIQAPLKHDS